MRDIWQNFRDELQDTFDHQNQLLDSICAGRIRDKFSDSEIAELKHQVDYLAKFIEKIERDYLT